MCVGVSPNGVLGDPTTSSAEQRPRAVRAGWSATSSPSWSSSTSRTNGRLTACLLVSRALAVTDRRVALVTGAARGIGAAVVRRLLARGYVVHALDSCAGSTGGTTYPLASRADLDAVVALDPERVVPVRGRRPRRCRRCSDAAAGRGRAERLARRGRRRRRRAGRRGAAVGDRPRGPAAAVGGRRARRLEHRARDGPAPAGLDGPTRSSWASPRPRASAGCGTSRPTAWPSTPSSASCAGSPPTSRAPASRRAAVSPGSTDTAMLQATAAVYGVDVDMLAESQAAGRPLTPDEVAAVVEFALHRGHRRARLGAERGRRLRRLRRRPGS